LDKVTQEEAAQFILQPQWEAGGREQKGHSRITPNLDEKKPVHTTGVFADTIMPFVLQFYILSLSF